MAISVLFHTAEKFNAQLLLCLPLAFCMRTFLRNDSQHKCGVTKDPAEMKQ